MAEAKLTRDRRLARDRAQRYRNRKRAAKVATDVPTLDPIDWIEQTLTVPDGPLRGQRFALGDWQKRFIRRAALAPGILEAGLSVPRKNGKSGLVAALVLAYLVGPLNSPQWRGIVASLTGLLAGELRRAIELTAKASGLDAVSVYRSPAPGRITGLQGASVQILAADKGTGHAVGADLAIIDEAGLLGENRRELWNAVLSSVSGRTGRLLAISVQGTGPMFHELGERADDPAVYWQRHGADASADIEDPAVWHAANPGLADGVKSLAYMVQMSRRAAGNQANRRHFLMYDLNAPVDAERETIVGLDEWTACTVETLPPRAGPCFVGVDLGGAASMTAAAAYWPASGRLEAWGAFGGVPDLEARGRGDNVGLEYVTMADRGELETVPNVRVTPIVEFLTGLASRLAGCHVRAVSADRYRQGEAVDAYRTAGIHWPTIWRGQGFKDGAEDVRDFQRAVGSRHVAELGSLIVQAAIRDSVISYDAAGNPKLDKSRDKGRIDALSAAVLAVAAGERYRRKPKRRIPRAVTV